MITHPLLTTFLLILFTQFHFSLGLTCEPICSFDLSPRNTICTPERCVQVKCSPPRCRYVCDSDTGFGINDNNECIKQGIKPSCRVACTKGVFGAIDTHKHCQTQCSQVQSTSPCRSENGCRLECENEIPNCVLGCVGGTNDAGKCQQFVREKQKYPLQCRQHAICNNGNDGDNINNNNDLIIFEDELSNDGDDEFGVVKKNVGHFNPNNNNNNNNNQTQGTNLNNKNSNNNNDNFNIDLYNTNSPKQEGEEDTCDDEDSFDHDEHNGYNNKTQKQQNDNNNQNNLNDNNTENDEQIKKIEQIHFYENCCTCRDIDNLTLSYQSALNRIMKSTAEYNQDNIPTLTELIQYYHQYGFQNCCQCAQKEKEKEKEKN